MRRVGLALGAVGGILALMPPVAWPIILHTRTGMVGIMTNGFLPGFVDILLRLFNGNALAVVNALFALDFLFAMLGIAGVICARRRTKLGSALLILAGIGLALSRGAGFLFCITSPFLVLGGVLILLGERRQKSQV